MAIRDKTFIQNEMLKYKNNPIQYNAQLNHKSQSKTPNLEVARRGRMSLLGSTCLEQLANREHKLV